MNPLQMMQFISQFKQNPMGMLLQKYNIPQEMNNPEQILKHLLDTKQVTQDQVNQAMQMGNSFKGLF